MSRIGECESGRTWNGFRVEGGKAGEGVKFERIRRITGYLVGTVERFNNAKRAEVMDRVKHTAQTKKLPHRWCALMEASHGANREGEFRIHTAYRCSLF